MPRAVLRGVVDMGSATSEITRSGELIRHKESPEDLKLGRINRPQPHPLLSVARAASNELCRLSAELGLTPSTWSRVAVDAPVDLSDFEKFRNERRITRAATSKSSTPCASTVPRPRDDIHQLWHRIVFTILISNTDDHLRNHGFLYARTEGWRLSPAYDLNPVPVDIKPRVLMTAINEDDPTASLPVVLGVAGYFELDDARARAIAATVAQAVATWRDEAARLGLTKEEVGRMASAFEHTDLEMALSFGG